MLRWAIFLLMILTVAPAFSAPHTPLKIGDDLPLFTLPNAQGKPIDISKYLTRGPLVLTFYRGGWCPVCNTQLKELQSYLPQIYGLGAQLVAISPETPSHVERTLSQNKLNFEVLSDSGNGVAKRLGILWEVPEADRFGFTTWLKMSSGKDLNDFNGKDGYMLPMPATFVVAPNGKIIYAFADPDYKKRAKPADIITALESIQ